VADACRSFEIIDYRPALAADFARLNLEWIRRYFTLEPVDEAILNDPESAILAEGGMILFAVAGGTAVGTCALKRDGQRYELTKMAVAPGTRGQGIGRALLMAAIARFRAMGGTELWLETAPVLGPAVRLYETAGFVRAQPPRPSAYSRSEIYMVYRGS